MEPNITATAAVIGVLKSAYELVRDLRKSNDPIVLKAGIEELTNRMLMAREDAIRIADEVQSLKDEIAALNRQLADVVTFEDRAKDMVREKTRTGAFVYREKASGTGNRTSPYFCPNCFENKKVSIFSPRGDQNTLMANSVHKCPVCDLQTELPSLKG